MSWLLILIIVFASGILISATVIYIKVLSRAKIFRENLQVIKTEKVKKEGIAKEFCDLMLGFAERGVFEKQQDKLLELEGDLKAESSRFAIAQAELESVKTRLDELEEMARELEASSLEMTRELDTLRNQERDLGEQTSKLRVELDSSLEELDRLLEQLSHNQAAVTTLNKTKTEFLESQEKVMWYQERISEININYVQLKKAYDALDIEYAQLYEKQNT